MACLLFALILGLISPNLALASRPSADHPPPKATAAGIITALNLTTNPEKGYYTQTFQDSVNVTFTAETSGSNGTVVAYGTTRPASTAIYYLLEGDEGDSLWHRIDAVEVWHYYAGAPMRLSLSYNDGKPVQETVLGPDILAGQRPQVVIGKWQWQSARSLGEWTLVGTTGEFVLLSLFPSYLSSRYFFLSNSFHSLVMFSRFSPSSFPQ